MFYIIYFHSGLQFSNNLKIFVSCWMVKIYSNIFGTKLSTSELCRNDFHHDLTPFSYFLSHFTSVSEKWTLSVFVREIGVEWERVCVCVIAWERQRKRERVCEWVSERKRQNDNVCDCVRAREMKRKSMFVWDTGTVRENECVCVCSRERSIERMNVWMRERWIVTYFEW